MQEDDTDYGILLGWVSTPAGENMMLKMQSSRKAPKDEGDVHEYRYFLTKQQAVQLGNFLFRMAGETAPAREKPPLLDRLLGG